MTCDTLDSSFLFHIRIHVEAGHELLEYFREKCHFLPIYEMMDPIRGKEIVHLQNVDEDKLYHFLIVGGRFKSRSFAINKAS